MGLCSSSEPRNEEMGTNFSSVEADEGGSVSTDRKSGTDVGGRRNKRYVDVNNEGGGNVSGVSSFRDSPHGEPVNCILPALNAAQQCLPDECFTCSDDRNIALTCISDTTKPPSIWKGHKRSVSCMVHGPRSDILYSCARDLTIRQWRRSPSTMSGNCTQVIEDGHDLNITALALSGDEKLLCSGSRDTAVCLWDVSTGDRIVRKKTSRNLVTCMSWVSGSGDNEHVVVQGSEDLKLRTWDIRDGSITPAQTLTGYIYFPLCIDISEDGHYIATGSKGFDGVGCEVRVWDRRQGKLLCEMQGQRQSTVGCAFLHGGHTKIASVSKDQTIRLWDSSDGEPKQVESELVVTDGMFTCLSASSAGSTTRLFAGSSVGFSVYDVGAQQSKLQHVQSWVSS